MRITNNAIHKNSLAQLQAGLKQVDAAQRRVTTGLKLTKPSDDPAAASSAMQARGGLRALEQYRRNLNAVTARAEMEENVFNEVSNLLIEAKQVALGQAGDTATADTRAAARAQVEEVLNHALRLGNTQHAGGYLFGGKWMETPPFDRSQVDADPPFVSRGADGLPRTPENSITSEISAGRFLEANHDGKTAFLDSGVLASLKALSDVLADPAATPEQVKAVHTQLDGAFREVQGLLGTVGARTTQLEITASNLDALEISLQTLKSDAEDVEIEAAMTELVSRQTAFQAAMIATSKVMGITLADYLR